MAKGVKAKPIKVQSIKPKPIPVLQAKVGSSK